MPSSKKQQFDVSCVHQVNMAPFADLTNTEFDPSKRVVEAYVPIAPRAKQDTDVCKVLVIFYRDVL